jgi:putative Mn2+ efflux pump MntP
MGWFDSGLWWLSPVMTAMWIGIGSNLDNCTVGMAYGSRHTKFPHWVNALMNGIGFCTALMGAYAGKTVSQYLQPHVASLTACLVLCLVGLFFWYAAYLKPWLSKKQEQASFAKPGLKQGILLGLALSITNVASGFGTTVANASTLWITVVSITLWGYVMIWVGNVLGTGLLAKWLGRYSSLFAGLLLIGVGLHQVCNHVL